MYNKYDTIRGATLNSRNLRALSRIQTYPRQLTYAHTLQNTLENIHLTAPSAVHLTTCFRPDSQHAQALCTGIIAVISASTVLMLTYYSIYNCSCQAFYKSFQKNSVSTKNGAATFCSRTMLKKTDRLYHTLSARTARVICHMTWKNY